MSYETVVEQVKTVPEECLDEISEMIADVVERYERQKKPANLEEFNALCAEAQKWAKSVGMTETDIQSAKKEIRREKARA